MFTTRLHASRGGGWQCIPTTSAGHSLEQPWYQPVFSQVMCIKTWSVVGAAVAVLSVTACSSSAGDSPQVTVAASATPAVTADQKTALRDSAAQLDTLAASGNAEAAYEFYSQRCKGMIGTVDTYKILLDLHYKDRNPQPMDWAVKINGSSGQVVTVDADPNAPTDAMNPRTWTYIDGRRQFDNC